MHMLILCLCVAAAFAAPSSVWENYKMTYSKVYDTSVDEQLRQEIFQKNVDYIEKHNMEADMGMHTYWVGLNQFSDWTDQEYEALGGLRTPAVDTEAQVGVQGPILSDIDWRKRGAINPVKDQGQCGSCWAFAALSSLEAIWKIKKGQLYDLSEQQLVDCSRRFGNSGCRGGWHHFAYNYIKAAGGIVETQFYRYEARDQPCKFPGVRDKAKVKVTGYRVCGSEAGLASAVSNEGPVGVAIDHTRSGWRNYRSGVYDDPGCSQNKFSHAVSTVGYDSNAWIVRNSWGSRWGDKGYILMKRGYNICGIATHAYYPTL